MRPVPRAAASRPVPGSRSAPGSGSGRGTCPPAVAVNEYPGAAAQAGALVETARSGQAAQYQPLSYGTGAPWPNDPYPSGPQRYAALRRFLSGELDADQVITALQDSGLRGMGGAGFPAGRKWGLVAAQAATPKYVICNADESEPGTFKDLSLIHI